MEFAFSPEQDMIAELARQLFAQKATSERTRAAMAADGVDRDLWASFTREAALGGIALPHAHGGAGLGLVELALVAEAAGRHVAALPLIASMGLVAPAIVAGGTPAQQARWLPLLANGDAIGAVADMEQAEQRDGDSISGTTPRVAHGEVATLLLVLAGDDAWLVERSDAVATQPQTSMDQTRPLARLRLDHAHAEPLADPAAARAAMLLSGCTLIAADALGGAAACIERTASYARERIQFGHPIGTFQAVKHRLADLAVALEQARSAVYWAAGADPQDADALLAAHAAKAFACETYCDAAAAMIQLHGGIGFTWEHDAHLFFKRATANRSLLGMPDAHWDAIADTLLGQAA